MRLGLPVGLPVAYAAWCNVCTRGPRQPRRQPETSFDRFRVANGNLGKLGKQVLMSHSTLAGAAVFSALLHDVVCREPLTFNLPHDFVPFCAENP